MPTREVNYYAHRNGKTVCTGCFEDKAQFDADLEEFQDGVSWWMFVNELVELDREPICDSCFCTITD